MLCMPWAGGQGRDPVWERDITHWGQTYWETRLKRIVLSQKDWELWEGSVQSPQGSEQGWRSGDMIPGCLPPLPSQATPASPSRYPSASRALCCCIHPARPVLAGNRQRLPHFCRIHKKRYWVF